VLLPLVVAPSEPGTAALYVAERAALGLRDGSYPGHGARVLGPQRGEEMRKLRVLSLVPAVGLLMAAVVALSAPAANAYGRNAQYQIAISQNCDNPDICGPDLGGFWGWAEFDSDNTADAQFTGCGHTQGGGGAGAGHTSIEVEGWYIGDNGDFILNGTETDTFTGHGPPQSVTFKNHNADTGVPATPGHYSTEDIFGQKFPGVSFQIQVVLIPGK
jgi:hypothetical protein